LASLPAVLSSQQRGVAFGLDLGDLAVRRRKLGARCV
jgi:hypothetical protein